MIDEHHAFARVKGGMKTLSRPEVVWTSPEPGMKEALAWVRPMPRDVARGYGGDIVLSSSPLERVPISGNRLSEPNTLYSF